MGPRDNRIHLGRMDFPATPSQTDSSAKSSFSGPQNWPKLSPGQNVNPKAEKSDPKAEKSDPWSKNPPQGMKKQKMRAEILCRTLPSELQTEPYSASYRPKPLGDNAQKMHKNV